MAARAGSRRRASAAADMGALPGAGGFGAYVDDVGAVGYHPAGQGHGGFGIAGQAVAGEGVGRQVDDAHYGGAAAPDGGRVGFVAGGNGEGQRGWGRGQVAGGPVIGETGRRGVLFGLASRQSQSGCRAGGGGKAVTRPLLYAEWPANWRANARG